MRNASGTSSAGAQSADVEDGWEDRWRTFHRPVRVGRLWVGPPWEAPPADLLAVVIDPGRAFGTGAHPTTQLCLELLQELAPSDRCSTSAADPAFSRSRRALLGHRPVLGVDIEAASIEATRENAARNGVDVEARLVEPGRRLPDADAAVANISIDAVNGLAAQLRVCLLVTSGYLASERPVLPGSMHEARRELGGWAADLHRFP